MIDGYILPEGWEIVELSDVAKKVTDGSHNPPKGISEGIPMISAKDVENNRISFDSPRYISKIDFQTENRRTQIESGDILLTIVATIGRTAVVAANTKPFALQRSVAVIKTDINSSLLCYYFQSPLFQKQLVNSAKGTAQKGVYLKTLNSLKVVLPPENQHDKIVFRLEELFSELDKGIEELKTAQEQLKVYRQAVLKWAFEGKLTNENVKEGELPEGWNVFRLVELGDKKFPFSYGVLKPGENVKDGIPLIKSQHIRNLYIVDKIQDNITKELDREFKRTKIKGGEILLNLVGASIGRCAIAPTRLIGANVTRAVAVLTIDKKFSSKYILYFLANFFSDRKIKEISGGSAQPVLNLSTVRQIEVPMPSIEEQLQIVQEIEGRFSVCDKMEETITDSLKQAEALRPSILKDAFEGKLVQKTPNDESASLLLQRIKQGRENYLKAEMVKLKTEKPLYKKSRAMAEKLNKILEILKESKEPVSAKTLWKTSIHKEDIDEFYAALKKHIEAGEIIELPRKGKESFLKLSEIK